MDQLNNSNSTHAQPPGAAAFLQPTGLSSIELAARRGIGPLSPLGEKVWHGQAKPCVSCGQLVRRDAKQCDQCGQDLSPYMLEKMRIHAGPWYVLEHVRPFPGVSLERLVRQVRRGVLTRTTVVRGPTTQHQWRFAAETPILSKYVGCCWLCQADVAETDETCGTCGADLNGTTAAPVLAAGQAEARTGAEAIPMDREEIAAPELQTPERRPAAAIRPASPPAARATEPMLHTASPPSTDSGSGEARPAASGTNPSAESDTQDENSVELVELSAAINEAGGAPRLYAATAPARIGRIRASWVVFAMVLISIGALFWVVQARLTSGPAVPPSNPAVKQPVDQPSTAPIEIGASTPPKDQSPPETSLPEEPQSPPAPSAEPPTLPEAGEN